MKSSYLTDEIQDILNKDISTTEKRKLIFSCFGDWMHEIIMREADNYPPNQYWGMCCLRAMMMDEMDKRP